MTDLRNEGCAGCQAMADRRGFLREAAAIAATALVSLGIPRRMVGAVPLGAVAGSKLSSGEVAYPVPAADGVEIDKTNEVILVRHGGFVFAFALSCPHQNTALRWEADAGRFQCPKHKSKYQPDGTFISGRATRNMDRLPIRRDGARVLVDVDRVFESDKDQTGWAAASVKV